jgi:hypothetical protein
VVSRARAVTLVVVVTTVVVAALFLRDFLLPQPERPLTDGPVFVLGGSPERVDVAMTLLPEPSPDRPLVLSHHAADQYEAMGGSCDTVPVRCIRPQPMSTWGEAQAAAAMAEAEGWPAVTVVTDDFHLARTRLLMRRCLDVPVHLVGTGDEEVPIRVALREAAAALVSAVGYHGC